ncbi:unnamed protein product, partial [Cuscuta europaea]
MSSSSFTSNSRMGSNLYYEPAVYCNCGLKAPLCVGRESGRKFYGCQRWKTQGGGCKFFAWKEESNAKWESSELSWEEGRKLLYQLRDENMSVRHEVSELRAALQSEIQERRNCIMLITIIIVFVVVA